jgi:hypothetical protein
MKLCWGGCDSHDDIPVLNYISGRPATGTEVMMGSGSGIVFSIDRKVSSNGAEVDGPI